MYGGTAVAGGGGSSLSGGALRDGRPASAKATGGASDAFSKERRERLALGVSRRGANGRSRPATTRITVVVRKRPLTPAEAARGEEDILVPKTAAPAGGGGAGGGAVGAVGGGFAGGEIGGSGAGGASAAGPGSAATQITVREPRKQICGQPYTEEHTFEFDRVYPEYRSNERVYNSCIRGLVNAVFSDGARCSCFAYGQTGSGKTFTMVGTGALRRAAGPRSTGLVEFAVADCFRWLASAQFDFHFGLYVSFYEIYCNKVYDLLHNRRLVRALESKTADVVVRNLTTLRLTSAEAFRECVAGALELRVTGSNSKNADSSRGHAVLSLEVRNEHEQSLHGKLAFIDLAGSERGADAMYAGKQTQTDGAGINKSLLALKECIRALDLQSAHVPFRDSELTKVLRDLFVGGAAGRDTRTVMLACVSPTASCCEQTLNTLRYADRVRAIRRNCTADIEASDCEDGDDAEDDVESRARAAGGDLSHRDYCMHEASAEADQSRAGDLRTSSEASSLSLGTSHDSNETGDGDGDAAAGSAGAGGAGALAAGRNENVEPALPARGKRPGYSGGGSRGKAPPPPPAPPAAPPLAPRRGSSASILGASVLTGGLGPAVAPAPTPLGSSQERRSHRSHRRAASPRGDAAANFLRRNRAKFASLDRMGAPAAPEFGDGEAAARELRHWVGYFTSTSSVADLEAFRAELERFIAGATAQLSQFVAEFSRKSSCFAATAVSEIEELQKRVVRDRLAELRHDLSRQGKLVRSTECMVAELSGAQASLEIVNLALLSRSRPESGLESPFA